VEQHSDAADQYILVDAAIAQQIRHVRHSDELTTLTETPQTCSLKFPTF